MDQILRIRLRPRLLLMMIDLLTMILKQKHKVIIYVIKVISVDYSYDMIIRSYV